MLLTLLQLNLNRVNLPVTASYTRFQKVTKGYFCVFAINNQGQRQFVRVPFQVVL